MNYLDNIVADKPPLVIDIGHAYTKCGFAGETAPHSIISSQIVQEINANKSTKIFDYKSLIMALNDNSRSQSTADLSSKEEETLRELLIEFLYRIYYKILNANSRERRVVIIESVLTPSFFRQTLADVLFNNFQALSVIFIPSHLASLYTLGLNMGLVVECGYTDCQIMPISEGVPMTGLCDFVNLGAQRLHIELQRLIIERAFVTVNNKRIPFAELSPRPELTEETLEDIKIRCCFVTNFERSRQFLSEVKSLDNLKDKTNEQLAEFQFKFAPDCDYYLNNNMILHVPGFVREMAFEVLFVDSVDSQQTIPNLILNTLIRSPIDLKKQLAENVVLIGGTCMLTGFKSRLVSELNFLLSDADQIYSQTLAIRSLKFHAPPSLENYTAWLGGAIFGSLDVLDSYSILNSKYKDMEKLPDWFTINIKNDMVHI